MLDVAEEILKNNQQVGIYDLINQVAAAKAIESDNIDALTQLYMDITLSGKFVYVGEDNWALKDGNLEFWDKDGYAFISPNDEEDILEDLNLEALDDLDVTIDDPEVETDEEELDEELREEKSYIVDDRPVVSTDEDDFDDVEIEIDDEDYDEDSYNNIMDDYEDMYED
jgi:DNA-directed RNA polymerase subunit delta